jgi:hypothetical protein
MAKAFLIKLFNTRIAYFYLFYLVLTLLVSGNCFFWDSVQLGSKHATYYYNQHLRLSFLPESMDSGHIPAFGYLLALTWKIFGRGLLISHFFMLPFLWGIIYQFYHLVDHFFNKNKYWFLILFLADPTLLAQSTLVSPDIPLVFFMLMLLNGIFKDKPKLKIIGVLGLALISMRGWMVAGLLFIYDAILILFMARKKVMDVWKQFTYYLPGGLLALIFLVLHLYIKGWIGYHENSPWAGSFERVGIMGFARNILIYGWRLVDFGKIAWWIIFILSLSYVTKNVRTENNLKKLIVLSLLFVLFFPINMLVHKYLMQHRYFLPTYLIIALTVGYIIHLKQINKALLPIILLILLCGNLIIYPDKIAQGWDSSLAHIPYYHLRKKAIEFMKEKKIRPEDTKSWFPNLASSDFTDLSNEPYLFSDRNLSRCKYCLYSNIFNDISDSEYDRIKTWKTLYAKDILNIKIILSLNPHYRPQ